MSKYRNLEKGKQIKYYSFEQMNQKQLNFFNVPLRCHCSNNDEIKATDIKKGEKPEKISKLIQSSWSNSIMLDTNQENKEGLTDLDQKCVMR